MKARALGLVFVVLAMPASAQTPEPRWEPFLGCWELTTDNVRDDAPAGDPLSNRPLTPRARTTSGPRVCVTRTADGGARFETTVRGQAAVDHTLIADGTSRPLDDKECRGTQRAEFSSDGLRIFSHAELTCEGDPGPRRVSGISLLATNGNWLDIQAVEIASRETVRVRRYYRADGEAAIPRATLGASSLSLDDVKEASAKVAPGALEAALVETNAGFFLSGKELIALDDAGVPDAVIDVIVALSYPERFVIERTARGGGGGGGGGGWMFDDPFMLGWAFGYPVLYDDFSYSPYYYSPFGFSRYGYRGYDAVFGGNGVAVVPAPNDPQPSGRGRAVDGLGYTRVTPRDVAPPAGQTAGGMVPVPNTSAAGSSGATASSTGGYSSGGGTASSGSSSGGSSSGGDSGGRTAQPR
jgi:hypothetical protein